jgi:TET-Associated Glycosyltransferase
MRYPIYVPSKGRSDVSMTTKFLINENLPFYVVVEPCDYDAYRKVYSESQLLTLPGSDYGGVYAARNWIKGHSIAHGDKRHWQLDDNISKLLHMWRRLPQQTTTSEILSAVETFCDRYKNVGIAGLAHRAFGRLATTPFVVNRGVYSCVLVLNETEARWRPDVVDDTDYAFQILTSGWCTVLFYAFLQEKATSGAFAGGNTDTTYAGDGRMKTASAMVRAWPALTKIVMRFGRPKVYTAQMWKHFTHTLQPV